jgi:hypothetical protein
MALHKLPVQNAHAAPARHRAENGGRVLIDRVLGSGTYVRFSANSGDIADIRGGRRRAQQLTSFGTLGLSSESRPGRGQLTINSRRRAFPADCEH